LCGSGPRRAWRKSALTLWLGPSILYLPALASAVDAVFAGLAAGCSPPLPPLLRRDGHAGTIEITVCSRAVPPQSLVCLLAIEVRGLLSTNCQMARLHDAAGSLARALGDMPCWRAAKRK
jgi:hypothetical protein